MLDDRERLILADCESALAAEEPDLDDRMRRHSAVPRRHQRALPAWLAASILAAVLMLVLVLPVLVRAATPAAGCPPTSAGPPDRCAAGSPAPGHLRDGQVGT